jgi:hypothetical protein
MAEALKAALGGYLKINAPGTFLGTGIAMRAPVASDGNASVGDVDAPASLNIASSVGETHVSCADHIAALCARLLPAAPDTRTVPDVPISSLHYADMMRRASPVLAETDDARGWYQSVLGSVNWLASRCRPDVAFAAHYLSRSLGAPTAFTFTPRRTSFVIYSG